MNWGGGGRGWQQGQLKEILLSRGQLFAGPSSLQHTPSLALQHNCPQRRAVNRRLLLDYKYHFLVQNWVSSPSVSGNTTVPQIPLPTQWAGPHAAAQCSRWHWWWNIQATCLSQAVLGSTQYCPMDHSIMIKTPRQKTHKLQSASRIFWTWDP